MPQLNLSREAAEFGFELGEVELTSDERQLAIDTWRGRMLNEHVSARVFAALVTQMMNAGVSASHQERVAHMIADELRHGRQCAAVVAALGGEPIIDLPELPAVPEHPDAPPLEGLLRNVLSISCLSETVAVALISAERLNAGHPVLEDTLSTILADEVQHARFGWSLLDELGPTLEPELKQRLGDYLATAFAHLREHELQYLPSEPAPSEAAEGYGACDGPTAREIFFSTLKEVVIPRLEGHGIPAERAWEASYRV